MSGATLRAAALARLPALRAAHPPAFRRVTPARAAAIEGLWASPPKGSKPVRRTRTGVAWTVMRPG